MRAPLFTLILIISANTNSVLADTSKACEGNNYKLIESKFIHNSPPTVASVKALIAHLNNNNRYRQCGENNSLFMLENSFKEMIAKEQGQIDKNKKSIEENTSVVTKLEADAAKHKDAIETLEKEIQVLKSDNETNSKKVEEATEKLKLIQKNTNALSLKLTELCISGDSLTKSRADDCYDNLMTELEGEKKDLPNFEPSSTEVAKIIKWIDEDKEAIRSNISTTVKLESAPTRQDIIDQLLKDQKIGANINLVMDLLDKRSAQIALFKQKLVVLQRNTNLAIELFKEEPYNCSVREEIISELDGLLPWVNTKAKLNEQIVNIDGKLTKVKSKLDAETNKASKAALQLQETVNLYDASRTKLLNLKHRYDSLSPSDEDFCEKLEPLARTITTTLDKSYDDSWFQNKNLESEIDDVTKLLEELSKVLNDKEVDDVTKRANRINFVQHSQKFFDKYNDTARFNIGLGVTMFNAPKLSYSEQKNLHFDELLGPAADDATLQFAETLPDTQKLSPNIILTMPYLDLNLAFPNISESFQTTIEPISQIDVVMGDNDTAQTQSFLRKSTIDWKYKVDFDANINFKILSFIDHFYKLPTIFKNVDVGYARGRTHIELSRTLNTELKTLTNDSKIFSELVTAGSLVDETSIDSTARYGAITISYKVADQLKLDMYFKRYEKAPGNLSYSDKDVWSVTFSYLYF